MPGVFPEDTEPAGEAAGTVGLIEPGDDRGEGVGQLASADQRVREQAMAGQMVGAIGDGVSPPASKGTIFTGITGT